MTREHPRFCMSVRVNLKNTVACACGQHYLYRGQVPDPAWCERRLSWTN